MAGPDSLWTIITDYIRALRKVKNNQNHIKVNQKCFFSSYFEIFKHSLVHLVTAKITRELNETLGIWGVISRSLLLSWRRNNDSLDCEVSTNFAKRPPFLTSETTFLLGIIASKYGQISFPPFCIIGFIAFLDVPGKKMVVKTLKE